MFRFLLSVFLVFPLFSSAQSSAVALSGTVQENGAPVEYANVILKKLPDSAFVTGALTGAGGLFTLTGIAPGNYALEVSALGFPKVVQSVYVGSASDFLQVPVITLAGGTTALGEVAVTARQDAVSAALDKQTYSVADNLAQAGGSVLQALQNLPGVTVQDGKAQLRGNDKVMVLIDGRQTALTGFNNQTGLDNLPASAIEKIEILNNPSAKYDANGNGGIINIIFKKEKSEGFTGKVGLAAGLGSLWVRKENLPDIRPQYTFTPKVNPSIALNYRKKNVGFFVNLDNLYTQTLNKAEFVTRTYNDGTVIQQELKRNRNTNFFTARAGFDWAIDARNTLTVSGLAGSEKILDRGDEPFFNADLSERRRLWQFLEDELKTTYGANATLAHQFAQPGHGLNLGFNYTFHREDEKYFYDNTLPLSTGTDAFKLLSDEQVFDATLDYTKPLRYGRLEGGAKLRRRTIPTNMQFMPGLNSVLDSAAGGAATYREWIPAVYGAYAFESPRWEATIGLRLEYVKLDYEVNNNHPVYRSNGYNYTQPFPNVRLGYKVSDHSKVSLAFSRRVDRPAEVDIRIFPKYDDAEIIKVGNPALRPQFTNSIEAGFKQSWRGGYLYGAAYHRWADGTITRIATTVPGSTLIYAVFQNAGRSYNTGLEAVVEQKVSGGYSFNLNANLYRNQINGFSVENRYPAPTVFSQPQQDLISGTVKLNNNFKFSKTLSGQATLVYLAPDLIPQGRIGPRFSLDVGLKQGVQKGRGEVFLNATDLLGTLVVRKDIQGTNFNYRSTDYAETQVVRVGYGYKF